MKLVAVAFAVVRFLPLALSKLREIATGRRYSQHGRSIRQVRVLALAAIPALMAVMLVVLAAPATGSTPPAPGSIENLRLSSENPGELTITWDLPEPVPSDYRISWAEENLKHLSFKVDNVSDRGNEYPEGETTSITLTGLTEGATFKIRMRARYETEDSGSGPWSGPWSTMTTGTVSETPVPESATDPATTPTTEPVTELDTESDEVSTEPDSTIPQVSTANALTVAEGTVGVVNLAATDSDTNAVDLTWTLTGGADQSHFSLSSSGTLAFTQSKDFEQPDDDGADGTYNITVQVSDGVNDTSADITVTLTDVEEQSGGPPAPETPTVFDAGQTAVTVNWTAPEHSGSTISGYDLQYRTIDETAWTDGPQDVTETTATIESLQPDVNYHVRVRAQDETQAGPWSEYGMGTTAIWESLMNVGRWNNRNTQGYWGFDRRPHGTNLGYLDSNSFTYDSAEYEIVMIARHHGFRRHDGGSHRSALDFFTHDRAVPDGWVLRVGGKRFFFNHGHAAEIATNRPQFMVFWINPGVTFTAHFDQEVSISRDPARSTHGTGEVTVETEEEPASESTGSESATETARVARAGGQEPQGISDLLAEVSHDRVTLRWEEPARQGVSGYRIMRSTESEVMVVHVEDTANTDSEYVDNLVGEGTTYTYSVEPIYSSDAADSTAARSVDNAKSGKGQAADTVGDTSEQVQARTLLGDPAPRQAGALVSLPKNSRGEYLLPVSEEGENYRHQWRSEESRSYELYSVNLEANAVYRVLVWDIEHFDHHLQSVGAAPGVDLSNFSTDPDSDYVFADFKHGDTHGRPYDYHVRMDSITVGGPEGRAVRYETADPPVRNRIFELSMLNAEGSSLAYVFQPDSAGDHTLRLGALAPGMRYHIRIEKMDDHPDGPSALRRLRFGSRGVGGRTSLTRYDDYTFGGIAPGDQDWFVVSLDANKTYAFSLQSGYEWRNLNSPDFVGLAGPDGMIKPWSRSRTTYLDFYTGTVSGDYYIGVQSGSAQGAGMYVLVVEEVDVHPGSRTNVTLSLGQWYVSFYQSSFDQDAFRVNLKADRRYTIVLNKAVGGSTETYQWSQVHNINGVCRSGGSGCFTSSETANSIVDYYREFVWVGHTAIENEMSERGVPWALGRDSKLVEFSVRTDGEYIIVVNNQDEADEAMVRRGAYRLRVTDYSADPPPDD